MAYAVFAQTTTKPAVRIIATITQSSPAVVATTIPHGYGVGMIVRLKVAPGFGMIQANNLQGTILDVTDTTFDVDIDTTYFDAFVIPPDQPTKDPLIVSQAQYAQVVPVGEVNDTIAFAVRNVLPY